MEPETSTVPRWPCYQLTTETNGTITLHGPAAEPGPYPTRDAAIAAIASLAAQVERPVRAEAADADGTVWPLLVTPEGTVTADGPARRVKHSRTRRKTTNQPKTPPKPLNAQPAPVVAPAAPVSTPVPAPATAPAVQAPEPVAAPHSPAKPAPSSPARPSRRTIPTVLNIQALEKAGELTRAATLAADLEEATARAHGPSHPEAVNARELQAYLRAKLGDLVTAARLYRDVAERQWHQGDRNAANRSAALAHSAWLQIEDPAEAVEVGFAVVRMRNLIPGDGMRAYNSARKHQARLEAERDTAGG